MGNSLKEKIIPLTKNTLVFFAIFIFLTWLPDIDSIIPLLYHRDMLTHSAIIPFLALLYLTRFKYISPIMIAALFLCFAIHLSADMFPKGWRGFALLHFPVFGFALPGMLSFLWLLANVVICIFFAHKILFKGDSILVSKRFFFIISIVLSILYFLFNELPSGNGQTIYLILIIGLTLFGINRYGENYMK